MPREASRGHLRGQARQSTIGQTVDAAMDAIERDDPRLKGVRSRRSTSARLGQLIET